MKRFAYLIEYFTLDGGYNVDIYSESRVSFFNPMDILGSYNILMKKSGNDFEEARLSILDELKNGNDDPKLDRAVNKFMA